MKVGEENVFIDDPASGSSKKIPVAKLKEFANGQIIMGIKEMKDTIVLLSQALLKSMGE